MNEHESPDFESLFQRALISSGEAYLMAETELRESPESAAVLSRHLADDDPIGRLMANVVLEWSQAEATDFEDALRYLDMLERRFAPTVARVPPITGVVENLTARFGDRLAEFLALRLVQQPQPGWRLLTTLAYLDRHKKTATTEALIRFAAQTREPRLQQMTARVLAGLGDPALTQKIHAERDRLASRGATLPPALASLTAAPRAVT